MGSKSWADDAGEKSWPKSPDPAWFGSPGEVLPDRRDHRDTFIPLKK